MKRTLLVLVLLTVLAMMGGCSLFKDLEPEIAFSKCSKYCSKKYGTKCKSVGIKQNKHLKFRCYK